MSSRLDWEIDPEDDELFQTAVKNVQTAYNAAAILGREEDRAHLTGLILEEYTNLANLDACDDDDDEDDDDIEFVKE